jgi:hypothetical protein
MFRRVQLQVGALKYIICNNELYHENTTHCSFIPAANSTAYAVKLGANKYTYKKEHIYENTYTIILTISFSLILVFTRDKRTNIK